MTFNVYQLKAMETCMDTCQNPLYMLLNLQGEVGELSGKFAKLIRRGLITFNNNQATFTDLWYALPEAERSQMETDIVGEIGDVLWQLSGLCSVLDYDLNDIAQHNLDKLASRKQRGVIDGNGDNR